jgi:integrase
LFLERGSAMSVNQKLTWADYPAPRVKKVKGKYSIVVSVPRAIRHLFGTPEVAKATGTIDRAIAEKKLIPLGNELYAKLDQKQIDAEQATFNKVDAYAIKAINAVAEAFKYNMGNIPALNPNTSFTLLEKMKSTLDSYAQLRRDDEPAVRARAKVANQIERDAEQAGFVGLRGFVTPDGRPVAPPRRTTAEAEEWYQKIMDARDYDADLIDERKAKLLHFYEVNVVETFWRDLLTKAAQEQGIREPLFEKVSGINLVHLSGVEGDKTVPEFAAKHIADFMSHQGALAKPTSEVVEHTRRVQSNDALRVSDVRTEYVAHVEAKYDKKNTQRKWIRAIDRFIELIGDVPLREIDAVTPHTFADEQVKVRPEISNKSITDYHMGVSLMLKFCVRKGYIRSNEFAGVSVKDYGKKTVSWLAYEPSEMLTIFDHDWSTQERLLLCIIATTGMRLSEAGMLTWERFNDTEYDGVRYFTLLDTGEEIVSVKNTGSSRFIPIHPDLKLPLKGKGRLFDYTVDENGLCSSSAGDKINPALNKLVPHIRKSAHSFRRTLKKMLRDVGVSKEINDEITGHGSGDVAGDVYGGTSIQTRAEAISRLDLSLLKQ